MSLPAATTPVYLVADLFLQALADAGVDYIFAVLGSDHPSIIEAYARRQSDKATQWPRMLLFQHEMVAISAADGYARMTHKAQCVLVHTDVGTAALGQGLHNASAGRAPVLIFAGLAPFTMRGEIPGSRSEHVQWMQDIPNQSSIVAPYVSYSNEIKSAHHVVDVVNRALFLAQSDPPGPTYITAANEVLAAEAIAQKRQRIPRIRACFPTDKVIADIGGLLLFAQKPIVITGYLGRHTNAFIELRHLATLIQNLMVIDTEFREVSFPANHPAWATMSTGGSAAIESADVILVLDSDVPWIPINCKPHPTARIIHIDMDVTKKKMQMFDLFADASFNADCGLALERINNSIANHEHFPQRQAERWLKHNRERDYDTRLRILAQRAEVKVDGSVSSDHLFAMLRQTLPGDTTYVHDAVTNTRQLFEQLQLTNPGTALGKGGSGLGWAGGAAIGVSLAMKNYACDHRPLLRSRQQDSGMVTQPLIVSITGDGAFMFGSPCATYWAQKRLQTPVLTIVLNNGGWRATRVAGVSDEIIGYDLTNDAPDYVNVAIASSNGMLWGRKVTMACCLRPALEEAVKMVQNEKRGALLEVLIS